MKKPYQLILFIAGLIGLAAAALIFRPASAHQTITVGDYEIEIGWLDEPPIVGQRNAVVINITSTTASAEETIDITGLKVDVVYGGESKSLSLQPLSEDSQGQYIAPILPTRPGKYTVKLSGTLGTSPVQAVVEPEEVSLADSLQFPAPAQPGPDLSVGLAGAALLIALAVLGISLLGLRKNRP